MTPHTHNLLADGKYNTGFFLNEQRKGNVRSVHPNDINCNSTVYVEKEGTFTDILLCLRFLRVIANRCGRVVINVPNEFYFLIQRTFSHSSDIIVVTDAHALLYKKQDNDFIINTLSLPYVSGIDESDMVMHLNRTTRYIGSYGGHHAAYPKIVGIVDDNGTTKIPNEVLEYWITKHPDTQFVSVNEAALKHWYKLDQLTLNCETLYEYLKVFRDLEYIIGVDHYLMHLAAAMGIPGAIVADQNRHWCLGNGSRSPWVSNFNILQHPSQNWNRAAACVSLAMDSEFSDPVSKSPWGQAPLDDSTIYIDNTNEPF